MQYQFTFSTDAMKLIIAGLSQLPYKEVGALLPAILQEAAKQEEADKQAQHAAEQTGDPIDPVPQPEETQIG